MIGLVPVVNPEDNSIKLSLTPRFVVFNEVVVPFTVKLPDTVILSAFNVPTINPDVILELPVPLIYNSPPDEISLVTKRRLFKDISSSTFGILSSDAFNPFTAFVRIEPG